MVKATNALKMKDANKRLILSLIFKGNYSRAALSKKIGLTKAALTIITDELLQDNLIYEKAPENYSGLGRRPSFLRLKSDARYSIGIGLSRSKYNIGLYDLSGQTIDFKKIIHTEKTPDENIGDIIKIINDYKALVPKGSILGIGVAAPGPVDSSNGTILNPPNFEKWHNFNIAQALSLGTSFKVKVENISNALAISEQYFGVCKTESDFAYIVVDEGIGSGIVTGEKIYRSNRGFGGELGHTSIVFDGELCTCGNRGCLERYASIPSIIANSNYESWKDVIDNDDKNLIYKEIDFLSAGIINLLNLFDLGTIVLGGDIAYKGDFLASEISNRISESAIVRHPVRVLVSHTKQNSALAAAAVVMDNFLF